MADVAGPDADSRGEHITVPGDIKRKHIIIVISSVQ